MRRRRRFLGLVMVTLAMTAAIISPPGVAAPPNVGLSSLPPRLLANAQIGAELRDLAGPTTLIFLRDRQFVVIEHAWLEHTFLPHFRTFLASLGPGATITEGMDCDNYADLLRTQLVIANLRGGGHRWGDVACAVLQAYAVNPFGGVPGSGILHALVAIRTSQGWWVVEPQTGALSPLSDYPNLGTTLIVSLE